MGGDGIWGNTGAGGLHPSNCLGDPEYQEHQQDDDQHCDHPTEVHVVHAHHSTPGGPHVE